MKSSHDRPIVRRNIESTTMTEQNMLRMVRAVLDTFWPADYERKQV